MTERRRAMFANNQEDGAAIAGKGFAARAAYRAESDAAPRPSRGTVRGGRGEPDAYVRPDDSERRPQGARTATAAPGQPHGAADPKRVRRLATVAAAAVAVALTAVSYGGWAVASSSAAVEEATAGALPTLVASADIRAGDDLASAALEARDIPAAFRLEAALGGESLEEGGLSGGRALVDIPVGTQIVPSLVTGVESGGRLSASLGSGMEAVTVAVDTETGIAGQIEPFDFVRAVSAESAASGETSLSVICERARVVAVGTQGEEGSAASSVTLEVTPGEADAVREAQFAGKVSFVLVSAADAVEGGDDRG